MEVDERFRLTLCNKQGIWKKINVMFRLNQPTAFTHISDVVWTKWPLSHCCTGSSLHPLKSGANLHSPSSPPPTCLSLFVNVTSTNKQTNENRCVASKLITADCLKSGEGFVKPISRRHVVVGIFNTAVPKFSVIYRLLQSEWTSSAQTMLEQKRLTGTPLLTRTQSSAVTNLIRKDELSYYAHALCSNALQIRWKVVHLQHSETGV